MNNPEPVTEIDEDETELKAEPPVINVDDIPRFKLADLQQADHQYTRYNLFVPSTFDVKALRHPALWQHVAAKLKITDEVRVMDEGLNWRAVLVVTFIDGPNVNMSLIEYIELNNESIAIASFANDYEVVQKGPLKWCLVHKESGEVIKSGIQNKTTAERELDDFLRALAR